MLDAYTVRKAIPRLVLAVIAINLSIYLCVAALDITTIVGKGLNQLLVGPFIDANSFDGIKIEANTENTIVGILGVGAIGALVTGIILSGGAVAVSILGLLLPFIITISLMSLAILFTLVIWQALVIFLTVISPIAFALYVLPGTEKYFRQWWDLFLRTLIVYPMIAVFFAMSNIMASILLNAAGSSPDGIGVVQLFATVVVVFAPLVLIPFAFKLSGGLISQVGQFAGGQASGLSRKAGQAVRQNRQNPDSWLGKSAVSAKNSRADKGFTSGQIWAARPGRGRASRVSAAREFDQFKNREAASQSARFKMNAQDSDALDSAVMNDEQVRIDKSNLAEQRRLQQDIDSGRAAVGSKLTVSDGFGGTKSVGGVSEQEYARKMQGHDRADQMGRTTATRIAAFNSADRIKFTGNDHDQELALAQDIMGGDAARVAGAMNEHQAIAKGPAGRTDLAASLYGEGGDLDKATENSGSLYGLLNQGRPDAIGNLIDQHSARVNDTTATAEQRAKSAAFLHEMQAASTKGSGTAANQTVINNKLRGMKSASDQYIATEANSALNSGTAPTHKTEYFDETTVNPVTGNEETQRKSRQVALTSNTERAEQAALLVGRRIENDSRGYTPPDPSERT